MTQWDSEEPYTPDPTLDGPYVLRRFIQYGVMLIIGVVLAFASTRIAGAAGVALAILALLVIGVSVWSILFMTVMEMVRRKGNKLTGR